MERELQKEKVINRLVSVLQKDYKDAIEKQVSSNEDINYLLDNIFENILLSRSLSDDVENTEREILCSSLSSIARKTLVSCINTIMNVDIRISSDKYREYFKLIYEYMIYSEDDDEALLEVDGDIDPDDVE